MKIRILDGKKLNMMCVPYIHTPYSLSSCETCRFEGDIRKVWRDL